MNVLKAGQQIPGQADGGLEFVCLFVAVVVVVAAAVAVDNFSVRGLQLNYSF